MVTIKVTPRKKCLGTVGYAKEHNYTQLHIQIDKRIQGCSVYDAEFSMANEEKFVLHDLEVKDNEYVIVPLKDIVLVQGKLEIQIVGHQTEPDVIVKSCVYSGIVAESVNAFADAILEENPTLLEQLYNDVVWIKENLGNIEINIEIDDKVTEGSDNLITSGAVFEAIKEIDIPEGGLTEIPDDSITTEKIKDQNVTREKIADRAINTNKIANLAITKELLRSQSVTTDKIAEKAVTKSKLADDIDLTPSLIKEEINILEDYKNYDVYSVIKADEKIPKDWERVKFWGKDDGLKVPESLQPYDFDFSQISETNYIEVNKLPNQINFDSIEGQDILSQLLFLDEEAKIYIQILLMQNSVIGTNFLFSVQTADDNIMKSLAYNKDVGWSSEDLFEEISNMIVGNYESMKIVDFASFFKDNIDFVPEGFFPEGFIEDNFETSPEILINIFLKDLMMIYNPPGYYISYRAPGTAQLNPVQSDYNINDTEDLGYIQNRPFYDSRKFEDIEGEFSVFVESKDFEDIGLYIAKYAELPAPIEEFIDEISSIRGPLGENTNQVRLKIGEKSYQFGLTFFIDEIDTNKEINLFTDGSRYVGIFPSSGIYDTATSQVSAVLSKFLLKFKGDFKQIKNKFLHIDKKPTENSDNLITSGEVYKTNLKVQENETEIAKLNYKIGNGQSDYTENDNSKISFIKNRPFYESGFYQNNKLTISDYTGEEIDTNILKDSQEWVKCVKIAELEHDSYRTLKNMIKIIKKDGTEIVLLDNYIILNNRVNNLIKEMERKKL